MASRSDSIAVQCSAGLARRGRTKEKNNKEGVEELDEPSPDDNNGEEFAGVDVYSVLLRCEEPAGVEP